MQVNAIAGNYYTKYNMKKNLKSPNFKGELNDKQIERVLAMLKEKISGIEQCQNYDDLLRIANKMEAKWKNSGLYTNSVGMMVIPENQLSNFLGKESPKYDLNTNVGICVAVGDKFGPVEDWNRVYDATLALLPKSCLGM